MHYRQIQNERKIFAKQIWLAMRDLPRWFREADAVWCPNYKSYLKFWQSAREIWGLFDDKNNLIAVVYLGFFDDESIEIHIMVLDRTDIERIIRFFQSLTRQKVLDGVKHYRAWVLEKNRALREIARKSGLIETGLVMRFGASHGKVLRWLEFKR